MTRTPDPRIETFNTHRMTDEVVRAVATGRTTELGEIMPAIRQAAVAPQAPMPALIIYGERGSGKSFMMRLIEIESASIPDVVCVLLPEEHYNIRSAAQILQIVAARIRGESWSGLSWQLDRRAAHEAWDAAVVALHASLDARFGGGQGIVVVLLENLDHLTEKLFGSMPSGKSPRRRIQDAGKRQAEERLRKLMNAPGGRMLMVASATGTVDMDYQRPLFQSFKPIDLEAWSSDTAIQYFNRRRALVGAPALSETEAARARAIVEFIGGNPRLAQLLGEVLAAPSAQTIASTLDALVDQLSDYYRQRMDTLPAAAAGILDALIRRGEPVSQTALAGRMGATQSQIADAFSFLTRSRIVCAQAEKRGAATLYRVRDRLFVHFYRRRYGGSRGLGPIAELLERFFTPEERGRQIRAHLERGEFDDARAFGTLRIAAAPSLDAHWEFRDCGARAARARSEFEIAGASSGEIEVLRRELRDQPDRSFKRWADRATNATSPLEKAAGQVRQAVAASRNAHDQIAKGVLEEAVAEARRSGDPDALILSLHACSAFLVGCVGHNASGWTLKKEIAQLSPRAREPYVRGLAALETGLAAWADDELRAGLVSAEVGLALETGPFVEARLLDLAICLHGRLGDYASVKKLADRLVALGDNIADNYWRATGLARKGAALGDLGEPDEAISLSQQVISDAESLRFADVRQLALRTAIAAMVSTRRFDEALSAVDLFLSANGEAVDKDDTVYGLSNRTWIFGEVGRHREAIESANLILLKLDGDNEPFSCAEAMYRIAWNLWRLDDDEGALREAEKAKRFAAKSNPPQAVWAAAAGGLVALINVHGVLSDAQAAAMESYAFARDSGSKLAVRTAIRDLAHVAGAGAWSAGLQLIADAVEEDPAAAGHLYPDDLVAAAVYDESWQWLTNVFVKSGELIASRHTAGFPAAMTGAGKSWGKMASNIGRAAAFQRITKGLPLLEGIVQNLPRREGDDESHALEAQLGGFVFGLVTECSDSGLLRDVADYLDGRYGKRVDHFLRDVLETFAQFEGSTDREAYLQRMDPDLATFIRRTRGLPDPTDTLTKRGRPRSRRR